MNFVYVLVVVTVITTGFTANVDIETKVYKDAYQCLENVRFEQSGNKKVKSMCYRRGVRND